MAPIGRPRTVCPDKDDLIQLGKDMLKWVEKNDPLHISKWWRGHLGLSYATFKRMIEKPEFRVYYDMSLGLITDKYLDGTIAPAIASRFIRHYFHEVKDEEDEEAKFKSSLKKQENEVLVSPREAMSEIMGKSNSPIKS